MPKRSEEFGEAVAAELTKRGLSLRAAWIRTGVDHATIATMRQGIVPRADKIIQFAQSLKLDPNRFLELAGYDALEMPPSVAVETLLETAEERPEELTYEPDLDNIEVRPASGGDISDHDLEILKRAVSALRAEQRRKQGRE